MSSNFSASLLPLEYRDVSFLHAGSPHAEVQPSGVPEYEVERRVAHAREAATVAAEHRLKAEHALQKAEVRQQFAQALDAFGRERAEYFSRVEGEIVQLDRMQAGTEVRMSVVPGEAELWRSLAGDPARWQVDEDASLVPGDCLVQTELGGANFGLEAQLCDVEQSFRGLLAHKPGAR